MTFNFIYLFIENINIEYKYFKFSIIINKLHFNILNI